MKKHLLTLAIALSAALGVADYVAAQDSVSKGPCLPGDAPDPFADSQSAHGSEQCDAYVVDLTEFTTSWGTTFGIAPIAKSSKVNDDFFGSLLSAQGISRDQLGPVVFPSESYMHWSDAGFGVNNDPEVSNPGTPIDMSGVLGIQKAAAFSEFAFATQGGSFNGVAAMYINVLPTEPKRLYIQRIQAAVNSCDGSANMADFGFGSIGACGNLVFRSDCFACVGSSCGLTAAQAADNQIFSVSIGDRDCDVLNVISGDFPGGLFDAAATGKLVCDAGTTYNVPTLMPKSVRGGTALLLATNFSTEYARGTSCPPTLDASHMAGTTLIDHRGNLSYTTRNCTVLSSTHGMAGMLTRHTGPCNNGECTDTMLVWGLNSSGNVTDNLAIVLPPPSVGIEDNADGFVSLHDPSTTALLEFNNYRSQTAFRGGNGPVALGVDPDGRLLAAASVDHPFGGWVLGHRNDWDVNLIAVARVECDSGDLEWTIAGYNTIPGFESPDGGPGKPILDGRGGNRIGSMVPITGDGNGGGPAVSAPMIDAGGNVWFVSAIHLDSDPDPNSIIRALLRAVYNADDFSYELELVLTRFDEFHGQNSNRNYSVTFIDLTDSNSISSGTTWSQNMTGPAHMNMNPAGFGVGDPRGLGGMVIGAEVTYDVDEDGDYEQCTSFEKSTDQDYNALIYIGSVAAAPGCAEADDCDDVNVCTLNECDAGVCRVAPRSYGDTNGDDVVDVFDIFCVLDASQLEFSSTCTLGNADLDPCEQDREVDDGDIEAMLAAFGGLDACCAPPQGACCTLTVCDDPLSAEECALKGGEYQGDDTTCKAIGECPDTGACCTVDECIDDISEAGCSANNGTFQGFGSNCSAITCPDIGACCLLGVCNDFVAEPDCVNAGGLFQGHATLCAGVDCPRGACCLAGVCSDDAIEAQCISGGGDYQGDDTLCAATECPAPPAVTINEIRIDQIGTDFDEYFELAGPPGASLSGLKYIVLGDGIGGSGVVETVIDLTGQTIPADGLFLAAEPSFTLAATPDITASLNFENSDNVTHMLVAGFTAGRGTDVDENDDGVIDDDPPWDSILDLIALVEEENPPTFTEFHYGPPQIGPDVTFVPGHVFRCPDATGEWEIGLFDPVGAQDTPGAPNGCTPNAKAVRKPVVAGRTDRSSVITEPTTFVMTVSERAAGGSDFEEPVLPAGVPTITLIPVGGVGNEISAEPGESITIEAFVQGVVSLRGYEVALPAVVPNGSGGTVDASETPPVVNTARGDYVFDGLLSFPASGVDDDNARLASAVHDEDALVVVGPSYLGEFVFTVSPGAAGDFLIEPLLSDPFPGVGVTSIGNASSDSVAFEAIGMVVHVTCTLPEQCDDGRFCNGSETCSAGACAAVGDAPCPGLPCDELANECCLAGDTNCDGCVNLFDYEFFDSCSTGAGGSLESGCEPHDGDDDDDVDLGDYGEFMLRFASGCP